jgi:type III pantothenate kinase
VPEKVEMLLVIDIGNTNIVVGAYQGDKLAAELRFKSDSSRTVDEYAALILPTFNLKFREEIKIERCIVSSVVPLLTPVISTLIEEFFNITPILVGPGIRTGLQIKVHEPASVGADRIVNALAAKKIFGSPVIVVDFGTATSFDFVNKEGDYEGGIIAPGLNLSLDSLVKNTAKLPSIDIVWPKTVIGKNTTAAMQSGVVLGYVCMVDGLIEKMLAETGPVKKVVATGGLGDLISKHSKCINAYDRQLTLYGLKVLSELNT